MRPLLSVVTVTYQDLPGLRRTLNSLGELAGAAGDLAEFRVFDGGTEGIQDVCDDFPWVELSSEPDSGIYEAMNKGLAATRGEYIWFLNGGDENLARWEPLARELEITGDSMLLCGYVLSVGAHRITRLARPSSYMWHGLPTSHQAIFYPGHAARQFPYDLSLRMSADYGFTARLLVEGIGARNVSILVATFRADGYSFKNSKLVARDASTVQRETLGLPLALRCVSRIRHVASRVARRIQAR